MTLNLAAGVIFPMGSLRTNLSAGHLALSQQPLLPGDHMVYRALPQPLEVEVQVACQQGGGSL